MILAVVGGCKSARTGYDCYYCCICYILFVMEGVVEGVARVGILYVRLVVTVIGDGGGGVTCGGAAGAFGAHC